MWKNWSGYVQCPNTPVLVPEGAMQLAQILREADVSTFALLVRPLMPFRSAASR